VFCKFLSDTTYSVAVRAAAARLLLSCHSAWTVSFSSSLAIPLSVFCFQCCLLTTLLIGVCFPQPQYPHAFDDPIVENIKNWVTEDAGARYLGRDKPTDADMLRTYAIGLLAMALCRYFSNYLIHTIITLMMIVILFLQFSPLVSGGSLVEGVLTMGVSAKLMRFLRMRVLGDASSSQKDANHPIDTKYYRGRDDNRSKSRLAQDSSWLDGSKSGFGILTDHAVEKDSDTCVVMRQPHGEKCTDTSLDIDIPETNVCDTKSKHCENGELLKRKMSRAGPRVRVKGKAGESLPECEITASSPTSGLKIGGQATRDRNASKVEEPKKATDTSNTSAGPSLDTISREEYEDRFRDCIIGLKDISGIVLKAVRAAEAEARSANAPDEAVKAAGDAAAELVKSSTLEVQNKHCVTHITGTVTLSASYCITDY
jgi:DDB1- and CUL4-associated factor 1